MRILHVANFNTHKYGADLYAIDRKISAGLIQNGHFVYDFSYRDVSRNESLLRTTKFSTEKVNRRLIEACRNISPHLLLLGHSELIRAKTLETVKKGHPDMKIALWYVDPLFHREKTRHIFERLNSIDVFFATTSGDYLQEFATGKNIAAFIPNLIEPSIESFRNFNNSSFDYDFIFCGRDAGIPERRRFLKDLREGVEKEMRCSFKGCLGNGFVSGYGYLHFLSRAKMGLNLSRRNDVTLYSSDRLAQLTGNGLLTFCPETPGTGVLYSTDEVVYFANLDELLSRLIHFHAHPEESRQIAKKGWKKAHGSYNAERVTKYMLERIFSRPLSSDYEWREELFQ
jgi:hypothetical protein